MRAMHHEHPPAGNPGRRPLFFALRGSRAGRGLGRAAGTAGLLLAGGFLPTISRAAEEAGGGGGGNPLTRFDPGLLLWTIITFVVLVLLLRWKAWPPIVKALRDREEAVRGAIEEARRHRLEAEKLLDEHKAMMVAARRETAALFEQGRRDAERVRQELLEKARHEQQEVVEQGRRQIAQETRSALASLQEKTVDLALAASEKLLRRTLDGDAHRRLVEEALKEIAAEGPGEQSPS